MNERESIYMYIYPGTQTHTSRTWGGFGRDIRDVAHVTEREREIEREMST